MRKLLYRILSYLKERGIEVIKHHLDDAPLYAAYPQESLKERRFYNVGASNFFHPFWTNIDFATDYYGLSQKYDFINHDLTSGKPLPIPSDSAELIYCSHAIEHISDKDVLYFLKESHRVLKKGAGIRLVTPDVALMFEAYKRKDVNFFYWIDECSRKDKWSVLHTMPFNEASLHQIFLNEVATQLSTLSKDQTLTKLTDPQMINTIETKGFAGSMDEFTNQCSFNPQFPGNHMSWWSYDKLRTALADAGFQTIRLSGYLQSIFPPLRNAHYFDRTVTRLSLYVEAVK